MKRLFVVLVVSAFCVAMAQDSVRLGVNLELSGRFAVLGTTSLEGVEAAHLQSPEIGGARVELSVCDNASTVEGSVACANRFIDEGVLAVLGPISTTHAIPAAETLQGAGIIMISNGSTNPATTQVGDHIFRMTYTDDYQGRLAARYVFNDEGARKAAIFRQQDDDYSFGLANFFDEEFNALGGQSIMLDYVSFTVDFSSQINDLQGFNPDVFYFSGFCAEGASLIPQLRQQGYDQLVIGADAADDSQCPEAGGAAFDGFMFTGFGTAAVLTGAAAERASEFEEFFRTAMPAAKDFNGWTLSGADSYNAVKAAIDGSGSTDPDAVLAALQDLDKYPGVSGDITFKGTDGTPADRVIAFFQLQVPADTAQGWDSDELFGISTLGDQ
jgi:branched-chain amino acid transport system substrate-binding protein